MLKISESTESLTQPEEGVVGVGDDNKARQDGSKLDRSKVDDDEVDRGKVDDEVGKKGQKTSKSKKSSKSKKTVGSLDFLTSGTKLVFSKLRQTFLKAPILYYFDLKRHIRIETDALGYAISGVFS